MLSCTTSKHPILNESLPKWRHSIWCWEFERLSAPSLCWVFPREDTCWMWCWVLDFNYGCILEIHRIGRWVFNMKTVDSDAQCSHVGSNNSSVCRVQQRGDCHNTSLWRCFAKNKVKTAKQTLQRRKRFHLIECRTVTTLKIRALSGI